MASHHVDHNRAYLNPQTCGDLIFKARTDARMTQHALGRLLGHTDGVVVRSWELHHADPRMTSLLRVADALGIDFHELIPNGDVP